MGVASRKALRANIAETLLVPLITEQGEKGIQHEEQESLRSGPCGFAARPDPEVVAKAGRRIFTAEYKQRVLAEADQAKNESGAIGALLRREGLYSSHLVTWRQERTAGILHALAPQKRGRKSKRNPLDEENQKLRRENQRLTEELRKTEIVIDVQKKVAALLGRPILRPELEEKP